MKVIVTGGAGFIGSALVRHLIGRTDHEVLVVDKLTYAGNLASLADMRGHPRFQLSCADICDRAAMSDIFSAFEPDAIMNLAAESHVDRSIDGPTEFLNTNIFGTYVLLEASLLQWRKLDARGRGSATITRTILSERWNAVINAAVYTDVDRAASEKRLAFAVNARGPAQPE